MVWLWYIVQFDMLLGSLQMDGTRRPGAIDRFHLDTGGIVEVVAEDTETKGHFEDAVKLYDLAQVWSLDSSIALSFLLTVKVSHLFTTTYRLGLTFICLFLWCF